MPLDISKENLENAAFLQGSQAHYLHKLAEQFVDSANRGQALLLTALISVQSITYLFA